MVGLAPKICLKFLLPSIDPLLLVQTSITQSGGKGVAEMHPLLSTLKDLKQEEEIRFIVHSGSLWAIHTSQMQLDMVGVN